jgi:hypothetical protein
MTAKWIEKEVTWSIKDVGASLLDSLARGLYTQLEVIREYIQNAIDAYVDFQEYTGFVPQCTVQLRIDDDNATVHIWDGGVGMDWEDIKTAKAIAVSPKHSRPGEFVGFRGIGIWSGLASCDQLVLETTKAGVPFQYRLTIDCKGIVEHVRDSIPIDELLLGRFSIQEAPYEPSDHFTLVKLIGIHRDHYGDLLDRKKVTQYIEGHLPVPFDPKWPYTPQVMKLLEDISFTTTYEMTINGEAIYRRFPSVALLKEAQLKEPQGMQILDSQQREVGYVWYCETARRGSKKALDEKTGIRNFAVRIKNFTIGERGLYAHHQNVIDANNLEWFVGEIYITDPSIRPDTKRALFEPSDRHDLALEALRNTYSRIALGARGWSKQVIAEDASHFVKQEIDRLRVLYERGLQIQVEEDQLQIAAEITSKLSSTEFQDEIRTLEEVEKMIRENNSHSTNELTGVAYERKYVRKKEVKQLVEAALSAYRKFLSDTERFLQSTKASEKTDEVVLPSSKSINSPQKPRPAKPIMARLKGTPVSSSSALSTQAEIGTPIRDESSVLGVTFQPSNDGEVNNSVPMNEGAESSIVLVDLATVLSAFQAALVLVLGETSETYRKITERFPYELKRRGINV